MDQRDYQRYIPFVDDVIGLLRAGHNYDAILQLYPELSVEDVKACHEIGMQRFNCEAVSQPVYCRLDTRMKSNH